MWAIWRCIFCNRDSGPSWLAAILFLPVLGRCHCLAVPAQ
ncbi:MAG: hypothetical protein GXP06_04485 [Alphaproteobacteria bacterium]|nr:hypothetical protein [Alphaproteobacteria bacterium]